MHALYLRPTLSEWHRSPGWGQRQCSLFYWIYGRNMRSALTTCLSLRWIIPDIATLLWAWIASNYLPAKMSSCKFGKFSERLLEKLKRTLEPLKKSMWFEERGEWLIAVLQRQRASAYYQSAVIKVSMAKPTTHNRQHVKSGSVRIECEQIKQWF